MFLFFIFLIGGFLTFIQMKKELKKMLNLENKKINVEEKQS